MDWCVIKGAIRSLEIPCTYTLSFCLQVPLLVAPALLLVGPALLLDVPALLQSSDCEAMQNIQSPNVKNHLPIFPYDCRDRPHYAHYALNRFEARLEGSQPHDDPVEFR